MREAVPFLGALREPYQSAMSSTRTAIAPSYAGGGGGGGGKRGRDGDDRRDRRHLDRPKPLDKISAADLGPDGAVRKMLLMLLQLANLGDLPSSSLIPITDGPRARTLEWRTTVIETWLRGLSRAPNAVVQARFTELADAFVHVVRAVSAAGLYDQLVAMLVELLTNRAIAARDE